MGVLAVMPVNAIYAGLILRESLVALTSRLAVWLIVEVWNAQGRWASVAWAVPAGLCGGLAILARNTGMAVAAASGLNGLVRLRRRPLPLALWGAVLGLTILPWAVATTREYGRPFYSYTNLFEYNFSWTVHHFAQGNTRPSQFYTWENAPEIVRTKVKSLLIIGVYSTMILGLPLAAGYFHRLRNGDRRAPGRDVDVLSATILVVFVAATVKSVADVTQVAQLGRYYLPLYVVMIPTAAAGVLDWLGKSGIERRAFGWLAASYVALVWAGPTWAYDATWFSSPYQLHWTTLREAGEWIRAHPEQVPADARVMTWFPWELRVTSNRTTVLMPRNYSAQRISEVIRQYNVTHVLWGSFDSQEHVDPETWGPYLEQVRTALGLVDARELHRSPRGLFYPVRLYRLR
jgi:hypothetical protein